MTILLDIDGVLVTTPSWKPTEQLPDGFLKFNERATGNLVRLINMTRASIVLTTSHRVNYTLEQWKKLFEARGIHTNSITKINELSSLNEKASRADEIRVWVDKQKQNEKFVIIDDDLSINDLPSEVKNKCVLTKPLIGLDEEATNKALKILLEK